MNKRLIILDRDGVINVDSKDFIKSPNEWKPIPGSMKAINILNTNNFFVAVATNQSGIGRKLYTEDDLSLIHKKMFKEAKKHRAFFDKIVFCYHHPDADCECRKPKTGMLKEISSCLNTQLTNVPIIGDSLRDIEAAIAVKARPILVLTGNGEETLITLNKRGYPIESYNNLLDAVVMLTNETQIE